MGNNGDAAQNLANITLLKRHISAGNVQRALSRARFNKDKVLYEFGRLIKDELRAGKLPPDLIQDEKVEIDHDFLVIVE